jgi:hypothetical protein
MDTDTITIDAIPDEVTEHARVVISLWLGFAREAWLKDDLREAERLHQLIRDKINTEMSRQRCGEED